MAKQERERMSAEEARTFERFSLTNAAQLVEEAERRGCKCKPYEDWFTYSRWQSQGMQVKKGEHGFKLAIIIRKEKQQEQPDGSTKVESYSRPWRTTVFCRCQVEAIKEAEAVI